jgi:adenylosuccinate synthase
MPVTVVVGGQFGSEGKGKVAHLLAKHEGAKLAIRVGGPNSGHTVIAESGEPLVLRQLPTAVLLPGVRALLPAGSYIDPQLLRREIATIDIGPERLRIHPNACVITDARKEEERGSGLRGMIGSTETGVGAAVRARTWRQSDTLLARDCSELQSFVEDYTLRLRLALRAGERVLVEGTQGFGLSVLHSSYYPYATSRDTTAAGFVSEAGLSPLDVDDVVLVLRSFPIRVAGNSGPLPGETSWEDVSLNSGANAPLVEYTSVTKRVRRVASFDANIVKQAIAYNAPTRIVLNHVDYIDASCTDTSRLSRRQWNFVKQIEKEIGQQISLLGTGRSTLVDRFKALSSEQELG